MPLHTWACEGDERELRPLFCAPMRPNETLVGLRFRLEAMFQQMAKIAWFIPIEVECAVWKIPLSQLGDEFVDLLVADAEEGWGLFPTLGGSGVTIEAVNTSGPHTRSPLHFRNRPWAGEVAQFGAPNNAETGYVPYVSTGVWHVARSYYEMEMSQDPGKTGALNPQTTTRQRTSDDLYETPPRLGPHIRTALNSSVPIGNVAGSPDFDEDTAPITGFNDSIANWAERLSLMTKPNQTYAEYLADFGVSATRLRSLPEPLMIQRRMMARLGSPQLIGGLLPIVNPGVTAFHENHGESVSTVFQNAGATSTYQLYTDSAGVTNFGCGFDLTRGRRIMADEPSILLGTWCFWQWMTHQSDAAHYLETTRMTHGSHWGNPIGGIEESDFLAVAPLWTRDGTAGLIPGEQPTGGGSTSAYNMLNLYLNGDNFCNTLENFNIFIPGRGVYDQSGALAAQDVLAQQRRVNVVGQAQLAIASDLVKG